MRRQLTGGLIGLCVSLAFVGCADNGPPRFRLSGAVTLDGQPIPFGEVVLTPDASQKNDGPQGIAPIKDGKYDTDWGDGMGMVGGAMVLRVNGMSGPGGKTLCEYELKVDVPQADTVRDIEVPRQSPKGPPAKEI